MKYPTTSTLEALAHEHNCEVFHVSGDEAKRNRAEAKRHGGKYWRDINESAISAGWYYWQCFPGCLPESAPMGPYTSSRAALRDAYDNGFLGDTEG